MLHGLCEKTATHQLALFVSQAKELAETGVEKTKETLASGAEAVRRTSNVMY